MRAPVSVIIPTLNAEDSLPSCLASLGEGLQAGLIRELILTDGGSADGTAAIADAAGATFVQGPASRGGQLRRGAEAASGPWLLFLHADTVLEPGWTGAVGTVLETDRAWHFRLGFDQRGIAPALVAGWANLRSRLFALPYGDQGLLVPRTLYDAVGGYPDIPLMEDVAIARALRGRLGSLPARAATSAAKYRRQGWLRRGLRNLWTLGRYAAGVSPAKLAESYRR